MKPMNSSSSIKRGATMNLLLALVAVVTTVGVGVFVFFPNRDSKGHVIVLGGRHSGSLHPRSPDTSAPSKTNKPNTLLSLKFEEEAFWASRPTPEPTSDEPNPEAITDSPQVDETLFCTLTEISANTSKVEEEPEHMYMHRLRCPFNYQIRCPRPRDNEGRKRRGRALVVYLMHAPPAEYEGFTEWGNFNFFLKHGIVSNSTHLFDGVDFAFVRQNEYTTEVESCSENKNLKFLWAPRTPCSRCTYALVLQHLGFTPGKKLTYESWPYRSIILMSSQVQGPFFDFDSHVSWIDIVSMAGKKHRAATFDKDMLFKGVATNALRDLVLEGGNFVVLPRSAHRAAFKILTSACKMNSDRGCEGTVDKALATHLFDRGFYVFSFLKRFSWGKGINRSQALKLFPANPSPFYSHIDPCEIMFHPFFGEDFKRKLYPHGSVKAMRRMGTLMAAKAKTQGIDLMAHWNKGCTWIV